MTETEVLFNGRWLRLCRRGRWEFADRTNPGGGVVIVAVTPEDRILFVEQWREALRAKTIEMPAGLVGDAAGDPAESAVEAARRELLEETGYAAGHIEFLMAGPSSSGSGFTSGSGSRPSLRSRQCKYSCGSGGVW